MCLLAIPRISAWTIRKNPEKHFGHWSTSIQALPLLPCQFGSTDCYGLCKTAANLPDAAQQSRLFRLCRVWLRPGLTGMLVRCMLSGTRFVVSAPKHKRKHSPTQLPDRLGYRLHRECNAVPERTFVSGNHSRCPPPAAWRLSHRVAECAEVWTHSDRRYLSCCFKTGATRHQVHQYIGITLSSLFVKLTCVSALECPFCSDIAFGRELLLHRSALPVLFDLLESLPTGHGSGRWS